MPFVIVGLGDLFYAVCLFCLAASIGVLTGFINNLVPSINILGVKPFGWLHDGIDGIHNWAVSTSDNAILRLRDLIVDLGHIFKVIFAAQIAATTQLIELIRHVNGTTLPNAVSNAESQAHDQVILAQAAATAQFNSAEDDLHAAKNLLLADLATLQNTTLPNAISSSRTALETEINNDIANVNGALQTLGSAETTDLRNVWNLLTPLNTAVSSTLPAELAQQAQNEQNDIQSARQTAQDNLTSAQTALQDQLTSTRNDLAAQMQAAAAAATALAAADLNSAEGYADAKSTQDSLTVAQAAAAALTTSVTELQSQITQNAATIQTLEATTAITLPALPNISIPSEITVPVAVGALAVSVAGIISEIDQCMVTACDGPNNYMNLLNSIMGGLDMAGIIAFLAQAVHDPEGSAQAFAAVGNDLYSAGHGLIDSLLSL